MISEKETYKWFITIRKLTNQQLMIIAASESNDD